MEVPKKPTEEEARLKELYSYQILDTAPEEAYDNITALLSQVLDVPMVLVSLVDETRQWFKSKHGLAVSETARDISFCGHIVASGKELIVANALADDRFADNPLVRGDPKVQFYAGCPLINSQGHVLGTLCVLDRKPRELSEQELKFIKILAGQITLNLELRRKTFEADNYKLQTQDQTDLLRALTEVQDKFISGAKTSEVFADLLSHLLRITKSEYGFIGEVLSKEDGAMYLKTHAITNISWNEETRKFFKENAPTGLEFTNLKTLFGLVITEKKVIFANDPNNDPRRGGLPPGHPEMRSFFGAPIFREGKLIGMIGVSNRPGGYNQALADYLAPFLSTCSNIITAHNSMIEKKKLDLALLESTHQLTSSNRELERSNDELGQFAYIVSHDLQAPLRHISTYASILREDFSDEIPYEAKNAFDVIQHSVDRCRMMIDDILRLASIGKNELDYKVTDLSSVIHSVTATLASEITEAGATITAEQLPFIACDSKQIEQAIQNIIENALKYSRDTEAIKIDISVEETPTENIIAIKDNGIGIPVEHHQRIFKMFQRLTVASKAPGSGIGLAICKKVVDYHGGRIWVQSEENVGSTFFLAIPKQPKFGPRSNDQRK